jgi:hypothetical protein
MSLETIASRLTGWMPKLPKSEAYNLVNDAWTDVRDDRMWSFQLYEDSIASPNVVTTGTVTTVVGSPNVTLNAAATTALTGLAFPLISQRQFRVQGLSIYNIVNLVGSVLTLDRPYSDPSGASLPYQVYQCYYPAPFSDWKRWLGWRDMTDGTDLWIYSTRREINQGDPQRLYFTFPAYVLPYQPDNRLNSSTLGNMMYELYPNPLAQISYMRWGLRSGADLINPGDSAPYPITDNMLMHKSRVRAYQWAEAQKDPSQARGAGADYKFLAQAAEAEYKADLKTIGMKDRDLVDLFLTRVPKNNARGVLRQPYFSTLLGRSYSG